MKKFFNVLTFVTLLAFANQAVGQVPGSSLNPFKQKGVGDKIALVQFNRAVASAVSGDYRAWNHFVATPFDPYVCRIRDNYNAATGKHVDWGFAAYMLSHLKLVYRHFVYGDQIWGILPDGSYNYYTVTAEDGFDALVAVYEDTDDASGDVYQVDLFCWDCFNPKYCNINWVPSNTPSLNPEVPASSFEVNIYNNFEFNVTGSGCMGYPFPSYNGCYGRTVRSCVPQHAYIPRRVTTSRPTRVRPNVISHPIPHKTTPVPGHKVTPVPGGGHAVPGTPGGHAVPGTPGGHAVPGTPGPASGTPANHGHSGGGSGGGHGRSH